MAEKKEIITSGESGRKLEEQVPAEVLLAVHDDMQKAIPALAKSPAMTETIRSLSTRHTANAMSYSAESWCERDNTIRCVSSPLTEKTLIWKRTMQNPAKDLSSDQFLAGLLCHAAGMSNAETTRQG